MATYMSEKTDAKVYSILEHARVTGQRVRLWYGDKETGEVWQEEYDVLGNVGRSTGIKQIFLLVKNSRSYGGSAILTENIMRITINKHEVYWNQKCKFPTYDIREATQNLKEKGYHYSVDVNGKEWANFKTLKQAENWKAFMLGERNSK